MSQKQYTELEVAEYILELLMIYKKWPGLYLGGPDDAAFAGAWVTFFHMVSFLGYPDVFPRHSPITEEVFTEHGWSSITPLSAMREAGLGKEEIFYEWIDIEIEALKRRISSMRDKKGNTEA